MSKSPRISVLIASFVLAAGCSGGNGGSDAAGPSRDLSTSKDGDIPDMAAPIDMAGGNVDPDLAGSPEDLALRPPDLVGADLTGMSSLADLSGPSPPDLAPMTWDVVVGPNIALAFAPNALVIRVGDSVRWTWSSGGHNVVSGQNGVADDKFCSPFNVNCANAPVSAQGAVWTHTFMNAGVYPYFCAPHANVMTGTITVR